MKFGMLHLFEHPMGRTEKQIVDEQLDIMVKAEDYGFEVIVAPSFADIFVSNTSPSTPSSVSGS